MLAIPEYLRSLMVPGELELGNIKFIVVLSELQSLEETVRYRIIPGHIFLMRGY